MLSLPGQALWCCARVVVLCQGFPAVPWLSPYTDPSLLVQEGALLPQQGSPDVTRRDCKSKRRVWPRDREEQQQKHFVKQ